MHTFKSSTRNEQFYLMAIKKWDFKFISAPKFGHVFMLQQSKLNKIVRHVNFR